MHYELKNVYVPSYSTSGSSSAGPLPMEDFTIACTPIKVSYQLDEFDFISSDEGAERPDLQMLEIKPPRQPSSQPLPQANDTTVEELTLAETARDETASIDPAIESQDLVPLSGLLLPAVQAGGMIIDDAITPVWDVFILG